MHDIYENLGRACRALQNAMTPAQCWKDYMLPVGESDEWVTAFVGVALAEAGAALGKGEFIETAETAFSALIDNRSRSAGFGFNAFVEADADSTATVLLLASLLKQSVPADDIAFLQSHQRNDGGFATFQEENGWGQSHACVTPVAALALLRFGADVPMGQLSRYGDDIRNIDGTWPAYWWPGPLYATAAWLRLAQDAPQLSMTGSKQLTSISIPTLMDLALAVEIAYRLQQPKRKELLDKLIENQQPSGLWPASKCLRVTDENCKDHDSAHGEIYADHNCLMTTAMAVRSIAYIVGSNELCADAACTPNHVSAGWRQIDAY